MKTKGISNINELNNFSDKDWSGEVSTKWEPSEGLFSNGSAKKIANEVFNGHHKNLRSSMSSINFYINRAGDNLSKERKLVLEHAKELMREMALKNFSKLVINSFNKIINL